MQISSVTVMAQKPDYRNIWLRAGLSFLLTIGFIGGILAYITLYTKHISDVVLYFIILIPFLAFMSFMRISMRRASEIIQVTITENGIYQKPFKMSGVEIFTPWARLIKAEEHLQATNDNIPHIALQLKKPKQTLIISSADTGMEPFKQFLEALRLFRSAVGAVNN